MLKERNKWQWLTADLKTSFASENSLTHSYTSSVSPELLPLKKVHYMFKLYYKIKMDRTFLFHINFQRL